MERFDYKKSAYYPAYLASIYKFRFIALVLTILAGLLFVVFLLYQSTAIYFFLLITFFCFVLWRFTKYLEHPEIDVEKAEASALLDKDMVAILAENHPESFLINDLLKTEDAKELFARLEIYNFELEASSVLITDCMDAALEVARPMAIPISPLLCITAWSHMEPRFRKTLTARSITQTDFDLTVEWMLREKAEAIKSSDFFNEERLMMSPGMGLDWSAAFSNTLDKYAREIHPQSEYKPHLYGHRELVGRIMDALVNPPWNVLITAEAGVGRHTILETLAMSVRAGYTYGELQYKRMVQIDASVVVSSPDAANIFDQLLFESYQAGNVILVIDNFEQLFAKSEDAVSIRNALLPVLKSTLHVIGMTSEGGYRQWVEKDIGLIQSFTRVIVAEPSLDETLLIAEDESSRMYSKQGISFTFPALRELVYSSARLLPDQPHPAKAIRLIDQCMARAVQLRQRRVTKSIVIEVISQASRIPTTVNGEEEKNKLLNIEMEMSTMVIGQNQALSQIARALRTARSGLVQKNKPMASFLFAGPTGVGKTETCKALARVYFGGEAEITRFDMSEYSGDDALGRLIGSPSGTPGLLVEAVRSKPYGVILFDEFEKASPKVWDIFLQILDEGKVTDPTGKPAYFYNSFIIATTNAASREILGLLDQTTNIQEKVLETLRNSGMFRPELLNRFDGIIAFNKLTKSNIADIAHLMLEKLNEQYQQSGIQVQITPELINVLCEKGYDDQFGSRPMRRLIASTIEDYIAQGKLKGTINPGDTVTIPITIFN